MHIVESKPNIERNTFPIEGI